MSMRECKSASQVQDVLKHGHWPDACPEDLRMHLRGCRECSDRVRVAEALRTARQRSLVERPAASASLIWWRAQLRRRQQAMEQVGKPMLRTQIVALIVAVCVACGFGYEAIQSAGFSQIQVDGSSGVVTTFRTLITSWNPLSLTLGLLAVLLLFGTAAYFAFERD